MTDVTGNLGGLNPVDHYKCVAYPDRLGSPLKFLGPLPQFAGSYQYEMETEFNMNAVIKSMTPHFGSLSGIKALAVSRVPAYDKGSFEGYIALREARESANSMAVKSAAALARFGYIALKSTRNPSGMTRYFSREAKQALKSLQWAKPRNAEDLWKLVLSGAKFANNANMEWKYGLKPMLESIQAVAETTETIRRLRQTLLDGVRVYGHAHEVRTGSVTQQSQISDVLSSDSVINYTGQKTTHFHAVASIERRMLPTSAYLDLGVSTPLDLMLETYGLNPSGKRLWQLMPLSFIIDWFWNVSSLLESLQTLKAPVGTHIVSSGGLYSVLTTTNVVCHAETKVPGIQNEQHNGFGFRTNFVRNVDSLTGVPVMYVPPLSLPTETGQWFSMAQIAFQRLLK